LNNANLQFDIITGELDAAKRETDAIFANVRQGLFLLAPDGTIGAQTSGELKTIFQTSELAKRNLMSLLRPLLPEKRHKTISDYFDILFDPRKNERQLQKFNPLKRVELNFSAPEGGFMPRHVEFSFQRIINNGAVSNVMVSVVDITERVKLEEQLREGEALREKQLELLFEILQVESGPLRRFIDNAEGAIGQINTIFMESGAAGGGAVLHDKVQRVFRIAHTLKSEAASLGLLLFERTIHQVENQLNDLRRNPELVNEDLLNVLVSIANFQSQLKEASGLIEKISGLRRSFGAGEGRQVGDQDLTGGILAPVDPTTDLKQSVEDLVRTVAARRGKQARVEWQVDGFDGLPPGHRRMVQHAIFQLVRNSVVHGIELPDARVAAGKDPCGCIRVGIAPILEENRLAVICRDDGAGLDADEIRARALREGLIKEGDDGKLADNDLYALIFEPGFSTAASVHEDAGRGVGLDVIRYEIVEQLHGEIRIEFAAGEFCEFGITVPTA
jgi:HPt (histidine-containing phosphotransfer) domain-containing protein